MHKPDSLKAHSDMAFVQGLPFFFKTFYLDEQMLPLYRGKPLHLSSSSSVNNKYGSIAPFSRISSCGFWLVEDGALRIGGNDALTPLVLQSCACLQGIQFLSEADTLERVWQKGRGSRSPCGEEA